MLVLQFLGLPQIYLDNKAVLAGHHKAIGLLAYLAVNETGRAHQKYGRDLLSTMLWPEYEQTRAFANLRRTIWEIHQAVGEKWLLADRQFVHLDGKAGIDLDVARFRDLLSQSEHQTDLTTRISTCEQAVMLYRNHFLTGFSLRDAPGFNEWAFTESEGLRQELAQALIMLVEDHRSLDQAERAIPYARRLITLDRLNESAHRQLMEVYLEAGQHSAALRQYQICEQLLRKELGLDPQPETHALYKMMRRGRVNHSPVDKQAPEGIPPRHNLPLQLSKFIGRKKEIHEIIDLLTRNRLVTLTGTGGIGKTRLALEVGQQLMDNHPDGVWFISLDSLSDPALIPQVIATSFNLRDSPDYPTLEILLNTLHSKSLLLILDNCEHLLNACGQLMEKLLLHCPDLKILATSREPLGLYGEATYSILPLSIPEFTGPSMSGAGNYEAIELFGERSRLVLSTFVITNENAGTIVEICRRVDGIPLAIELAAANINMLQPEEILEQLSGSFTLLATSSQHAIQRHQTLAASMDWSWKLLTETEQVFMQQTSLFEGSWSLESAQAICDEDSLKLTSALVKKSLIIVDQNPGHPTRYRFHENIRQYARRKLVEAGKEPEIITRYLQYYLKLSDLAEAELKGVSQFECFARLKDDIGNIRAALELAAKADVQTGLFISGRLWLFWEGFNMEEGKYWLNEFISAAESKDYPLAKAKALCALGWSLHRLAKFAQARSAAQECLTIYENGDDRHGEVDALTLLGTLSLKATGSGMKLLRQALSLAKSLDDRWRQAYVLGRMGVFETRDHQKRFAYWTEAISLFREAGDSKRTAEYSTMLGFYEILENDLNSAQERLDEVASLNRQLDGNTDNFWLTAHGQMALIRRDYDQARANFEKAVSNAQKLGNTMDILWGKVRLGYLALYEGHTDEARSIFARTAQQFHSHKSEIGVIFSLEGMARVFVIASRPEHSAQLTGWSDKARQKIKDTRPLLEQGDVEGEITTLIEKLGEVRFQDAYRKGAALTLDEAVTLALEADEELRIKEARE